MPIARRVSSPQQFAVPKKVQYRIEIPATPIPDTGIIVFTEKIKEIVGGLPLIDHVEDAKSLYYKYIVPNDNRWACFNGYWLKFWPAHGRARGAPEGHVKVLAIICQTVTNERSPDQQPTLRLSDPDMTLWPTMVKSWTKKLARSGHTPALPVKIYEEK